tara:strand:+ start:10240 stop:11538 length:1299 start_codon:yes stop_codon:yes gene_type:complete
MFVNLLNLTGLKKAMIVYADRRQVVILLMGFSSGLPLLLGFSTLSFWLSREGISLSAIGGLVAVSIPYSLKFLWAPVLDGLQLPILTKFFGRRRGWILLTQVLLIIAIISLGASDPRQGLVYMAIMAFVLAFISASQDIVVDAYRIEILSEVEQGAGAASTQIGYRAGLLVAGAGSIALSSILSWFWIYTIMGAMVTVGILAVLLAKEPKLLLEYKSKNKKKENLHLRQTLKNTFLEPLADLAQRPGIVFVLMFILLYKYGDAIAGAMANPFFDRIGFTALEIASVTKVFGVLATITGVILGGVLVAWLGIWLSLLVGGIFQALTNILFSFLAYVGPDIYVLGMAIGFDNFAGGLGSTALVAYLSALCSKSFTGTQFALLTSLVAFGRTLMAMLSGWLVDSLGWVWFFLGTSFLAIPGLLLLLWIKQYKTSM